MTGTRIYFSRSRKLQLTDDGEFVRLDAINHVTGRHIVDVLAADDVQEVVRRRRRAWLGRLLQREKMIRNLERTPKQIAREKKKKHNFGNGFHQIEMNCG